MIERYVLVLPLCEEQVCSAVSLEARRAALTLPASYYQGNENNNIYRQNVGACLGQIWEQSDSVNCQLSLMEGKPCGVSQQEEEELLW